MGIYIRRATNDPAPGKDELLAGSDPWHSPDIDILQGGQATGGHWESANNVADIDQRIQVMVHNPSGQDIFDAELTVYGGLYGLSGTTWMKSTKEGKGIVTPIPVLQANTATPVSFQWVPKPNDEPVPSGHACLFANVYRKSVTTDGAAIPNPAQISNFWDVTTNPHHAQRNLLFDGRAPAKKMLQAIWVGNPTDLDQTFVVTLTEETTEQIDPPDLATLEPIGWLGEVERVYGEKVQLVSKAPGALLTGPGGDLATAEAPRGLHRPHRGATPGRVQHFAVPLRAGEQFPLTFELPEDDSDHPSLRRFSLSQHDERGTTLIGGCRLLVGTSTVDPFPDRAHPLHPGVDNRLGHRPHTTAS